MVLQLNHVSCVNVILAIRHKTRVYTGLEHNYAYISMGFYDTYIYVYRLLNEVESGMRFITLRHGLQFCCSIHITRVHS